MKKQTALGLIVAAFLCVSVPVLAGGGSGSTSPPPEEYWKYEEILEFFKSNANQFCFDKSDDGGNQDIAMMPDRRSPELGLLASSSVRKKKHYGTTKKSDRISVFHQSRPGKPVIQTFESGSNITIDWDHMAANPGDIIFSRALTKRDLFTTLISSWSHCAMIWSKAKHQVFESMPDGGVKVNVADNFQGQEGSWKHVVGYGTKSIRGDLIGSFITSIEDPGSGSVIDYTGYPDAYYAVYYGISKYT